VQACKQSLNTIFSQSYKVLRLACAPASAKVTNRSLRKSSLEETELRLVAALQTAMLVLMTFEEAVPDGVCVLVVCLVWLCIEDQELLTDTNCGLHL